MTTRGPKRATMQTELGEEVQCAKCREFWPADTEFFFFNKGKPHSYCKACYRSTPATLAKVERGAAKVKAQRAEARAQKLFTSLSGVAA